MALLTFCGKPILRLEGPKKIEESKPKAVEQSEAKTKMAPFEAALEFMGGLAIGMFIWLPLGALMVRENLQKTVYQNGGTLVLTTSVAPQGMMPIEYANIWDLDENKIVKR